MSQEARTIRPFIGLESIEAAFDDSKVHLGDVTCFAGASVSIDLEPHEYTMRPVVLQWASDDTGVASFKEALISTAEALVIDPKLIGILVTASTPYLKTTEVAFLKTVADLGELNASEQLTGNPRLVAFRTGHHGCVIDAYVVLLSEIEERPLRPSRKGTWLAHAQFRLLTEIGRSMFRPTPMNGEKKKELGLNAKTVRYFQMADHDPLAAYDEQPDKPTLFVDEDLLAELSANSRTPGSISMQLQLVVDFLGAVVNQAARHEDLKDVSYEDIKESLLGRVLRVAAGPGSTDGDRDLLLNLVRTEPAKIIALAEDRIDIQKSFTNALHGGDE